MYYFQYIQLSKGNLMGIARLFFSCGSRSMYVILLGLLILSGCTTLQLPVVPQQSTIPQANAERLFINGDFDNALLEYEQIYETALSPEDKNIALYGLACSQMMLARSDEQLLEAIRNLQRWDANKGSAPFVENHHLLVLALKRQGELIQEKNLEQAQRETRKNTLIEQQRRKISQMATTLEKFQKQLTELEAMDEIIQEKRRPL